MAIFCRKISKSPSGWVKPPGPHNFWRLGTLHPDPSSETQIIQKLQETQPTLYAVA